MRKFFLTISIITFLIIDIMVIDVLWPAETTKEQELMALQYLEENNLTEPPFRFEHDGCTLFPDRIPGYDFREPCLAHDIAYWAGGPAIYKNRADLAFLEALKHTGRLGAFVFAPLMYSAVTYFGDSWLTNLFDAEWGYGWDH